MSISYFQKNIKKNFSKKFTMKKVTDRLPILEETEPKSNFGTINKSSESKKSVEMNLEKLIG